MEDFNTRYWSMSKKTKFKISSGELEDAVEVYLKNGGTIRKLPKQETPKNYFVSSQKPAHELPRIGDLSLMV